MKQAVNANMDQSAIPVAAATDQPDGQRVYAVPALEKGLDVLELLASQEQPVTLTGIAQTLSRSPTNFSEFYPSCSGVAGSQGRPGTATRLSARLFELATAFPPAKRLADVALVEMRAVSRDLRQSCHLSVPDEGELLVALDVEAPGPAEIFVRAGTRYLPGATASGRVMIAFGYDFAAHDSHRSPTPEGAERPVPTDLSEADPADSPARI